MQKVNYRHNHSFWWNFTAYDNSLNAWLSLTMILNKEYYWKRQLSVSLCGLRLYLSSWPYLVKIGGLFVSWYSALLLRLFLFTFVSLFISLNEKKNVNLFADCKSLLWQQRMGCTRRRNGCGEAIGNEAARWGAVSHTRCTVTVVFWYENWKLTL